MPSPTRSELPSWWRVVATLGIGTVIALALALAITTMSEGSDPRPVAAIGSVHDLPFAEDDLPHPGVVSLPWQRIEVAVGDPQGQLPPIHGEAADIAPPEGGSFVRVDARSVADSQLAFAAIDRPLQVDVEIVLRADGAEYPLSGPGGLDFDPNDTFLPATGGRWVAVPGHPSDLEVAVLVDDQEQTVQQDGSVDHGRATGLTDLEPLTLTNQQDERACDTVRRTDHSELRLPDYRDEPACTIKAVFRTPYADGIGWARDDHEYLVVVATHEDVLSVDHPDGERWRATNTFTGRIDGAEPVVEPVDINAVNTGTLALQDPDDPRMLVFEVPESGSTGDLTLALDVDARSDDAFGSSSREQMHLEWTVPAEELR